MRLKYIFFASFALTLGSLVSCSKSSSYGGTTTPPPTTTPPVTTTASFQLKTDSHFGSIITDGSGKSLYFFSLDANGNSSCTVGSGCLALWPVAYVANPTIGAGLSASDFSSITRSDGAKQTTYKGWPLYTYSGDVHAGDVFGDGIAGIWFVAKPDYTVMLAVTQLSGFDGVKYDSTYKAATGGTMYMTTDRGVTLYSFTVDKSGKNNYTLSDFSNDDFWPIVQISSVQNVPSGLDKSAFSSITVFTKPQMTFKGWPVYRFGPDSLGRGNTKGISVPTPGIWHVMDQFSALAPQ